MGKKLTIEQAKITFEKEGYALLENIYKNARTPMEYKCPNGHIHKMSYDNFNRGKRCPECQGKLKHTYEEIRQFFEGKGYILLSNEYINGKQKLEYICPKGHKHSMSWSNFQKGKQCPECAIENKASKRRMNFQIIKECFKKRGYILLTKEEEYMNNHTLLDYVCPNGHKNSMTWNNFQRGRQCPNCANIYKGENRIEDYLVNNNINFISQHIILECRNIQPLRFDFYLPDYNMCIEYDGEGHFHPVDFSGKGIEFAKEQFEKGQENDQIKNIYCKNNNINLLRIPYWEFDNIENIICQEIEKLKTFDGQVS